MKLNKITIFAVILLLAGPVLAATTDFTANGNITVAGVTFGSGTADLMIMSGSSAESWNFDSGDFTVTNPDATANFKVGSSDSSVNAVKATRGGSDVACAENNNPGTSYMTLPSNSGVYTITPLTITDCRDLCARVNYAASYNSFPTCGAASCNPGYVLVGSGSSAVCAPESSGIIGGSTTPCASVEYDEWQDTCINGTQYRNVISSSPSGCVLTESQNDARQRACGDAVGETGVTTPSSDELYLDEAQNIFYNIIDEPSQTKEDEAKSILSDKMGVDIASLASAQANSLVNFIAYGTASTESLGAGERAGVINSFKAAFGRLPSTDLDWQDIIKIANGRWPSQRSEEAENKAIESFEKIYLREPNRSNPNDDAAVVVMAYGLRPVDRNMGSEAAAINSFRAIYNYDPTSATDWDIVRAIAYSGATR